MTPLRQLILATVAILVGMCGNPVGLQAQGSLEPYQPASDRMYWTATMNRWEGAGAGRTSMRGYFGLLLGHPKGAIMTTATFWFREEQSDGVRRIVMEKGKWDCSIKDLVYQFPDGGRAPGGPDAYKKGQLDLKHCTATVNYQIDKSSGKKIVHVSFGLEAEDPLVKYQYFPMKHADNPRDPPFVDDKLKDDTLRMQREGQTFAERYTDDNNITLRSHTAWPNRGETWIVRGTSQAESAELVLEPLGYDDWWPAGGRDENTPGNAITVKATLQGRGGGPPRVPARRIRFELGRVSNEPGVALNWPPFDQSASTPRPDFQIDPDRNGELSVTGANGQKAQTPDGEYHEATVVISAYDWGAFGRLRAVADLTTGGSVVGYLKGEPGGIEILLPKRQEDSRIADPWKKHTDAEYLADDSDGEDDPVGNGFKGDGLSLYEEYRGFIEQGDHIGGNPKKKDLFLRDEINTPFSKQSITLFQTVSGINVHHRLRQSELSGQEGSNLHRVINLNYRSAHLVNQHALVMKVESPGFTGGEAVGGPGLPRVVSYLRLHRATSHLFRRFDDAAILAHEMLHGCNVWHHGERDLGLVEWQMGTHAGQPSILEYALNDDGSRLNNRGRPIAVYRSNGSSRLPVRPQRFLFGTKIWVAASQGGQHSGVKECLMAYDVAGAVAGPEVNGVRERTLVSSPPNLTVLCRTSRRTSHFGDADSSAGEGPRQRGACTKQICVNDKYGQP